MLKYRGYEGHVEFDDEAGISSRSGARPEGCRHIPGKNCCGNRSGILRIQMIIWSFVNSVAKSRTNLFPGA